MKKSLILFVCLLCLNSTIFAQRYYKSVDLFAGVGANTFNNFTAGISLTYGINLNNYFSLGLGAGCRYSNDVSSVGDGGDYSISYLLVPLHARLKVNLGTPDKTPFFMFDGGWSYDFWRMRHVVLLEPSLGVNYKDKMTLSAGVIMYPGTYTKTRPINSPSSVGYGPVDGWAYVVCARVGFYIK